MVYQKKSQITIILHFRASVHKQIEGLANHFLDQLKSLSFNP